MAAEGPTGEAMGDADDVVDRVEKSLLDRREFLVGAAVGGLGVGVALGAGAFAGGTRLERRATLASSSAGAGVSSATYHLPAVGSDGQGLVIGVSMALREGAGDVYVNLEEIEVRHDVQLALKEAAVTAASVTETSLDDRDVLVSFDPPGEGQLALRGKSWEAGLTTTLIGILTGRQPSEVVLVTGVVGSAGELLPVGGIEAKAEAARAFGAETLLVPPDETVSVSGIEVETATDIDAVVHRVLG
ncbi:MAG: S16 family serine protease [Halobacteriales archaeon]|nr:S16 family serine protease [Halobacteriales archaeon]